MTDDAFVFERFRLAPGQRTLLENGVPVRLGSRALDILIVLARAEGEIVGAGRILEAVWPNIHVDQTALRVHISALRRALGRREDGGAFILNIPGRGYKLVGDIRREASPGFVQAEPTGPARTPPSNVTRLIGRDELVEELCEDLPRRQFLTLVGPGGSPGKTSLALEVARPAGATLQSGVAFADLSAISEPTCWCGRSVALALGLTAAVEDPTPAILSLLRGRRSLLVLDNCEHLIEAAAAVAEALCEGAPGLDLLATSREPLRACGEWVHRLPPLGFPTAGTVLNAAEARLYPSIEALFVERATARANDFRFHRRERIPGGRHLPQEAFRRVFLLAIELAASWSGVLSLKELARRLDGHLMLRAQGREGARRPATARCAPPSTGATTCLRNRSRGCFDASPCLLTSSRWEVCHGRRDGSRALEQRRIRCARRPRLEIAGVRIDAARSRDLSSVDGAPRLRRRTPRYGGRDARDAASAFALDPGRAQGFGGALGLHAAGRLAAGP